MSVVCRFRVTQKAELEHYLAGKGNAFQVKMTGVKSKPFGSATPAANVEMLIIPEEAAQEFKVGKFYLVTFELDPDQSFSI